MRCGKLESTKKGKEVALVKAASESIDTKDQKSIVACFRFTLKDMWRKFVVLILLEPIILPYYV